MARLCSVVTRLRGDERVVVEARMEEYKTACKLANGPDPGRSRYWNGRRVGLERLLRKVAEL